MFVLVDGAMLLIEEAVLDPSPDEAVPINRMEVRFRAFPWLHID